MIKLGFGIQITQTGNNGPKLFNEGSWSKHIIDLRETLSLLHSHGIYCYDIPVLFSYTHEGMIITLVREIKGRINDNITAFIFVPKRMDISADELYDVVTTVKNELGQSTCNLPLLKEVFSRDYPEKEFFIDYKESAPCNLAYRIVPNKYSLKELLGNERYQLYYTRYRYILILEDANFVNVNENTAAPKSDAKSVLDNLTSKDLESYCSLLPPTEEQLYRLSKRRITLQLNTGEPFNQPCTGLKEDEVQLTIMRQGFIGKELTLKLRTLGEKFNVNQIESFEWKKLVTPQYFTIIDQETLQPVKGCRIWLNDIEVGRSGIKIKEEECKKVHLTIEHEDYEPFSKNINLLTNSKAEINLLPIERTYVFPIKLKNRQEGELHYSSRKEINQNHSLLYRYTMKNGILVYNKEAEKKTRLKQLAIGLGTGVVIGLFLGLAIATCFLGGESDSEKSRNTDRLKENNPYEYPKDYRREEQPLPYGDSLKSEQERINQTVPDESHTGRKDSTQN